MSKIDTLSNTIISPEEDRPTPVNSGLITFFLERWSRETQAGKASVIRIGKDRAISAMMHLFALGGVELFVDIDSVSAITDTTPFVIRVTPHGHHLEAEIRGPVGHA